jgi:NADH:ubiquinone oxidoreductase subunit 2 (subunit N)
VVATVLSVPYYLGVIRAMFFSPAQLRVAPAGGSPPHDAPLTAAVAGALVVSIGSLFLADPLIDLARNAVESLPFPH